MGVSNSYPFKVVKTTIPVCLVGQIRDYAEENVSGSISIGVDGAFTSFALVQIAFDTVDFTPQVAAGAGLQNTRFIYQFSFYSLF